MTAGVPIRRALVRAALLAAAAALLAQAAFPGKSPDDRGYDVQRYSLDLSIVPESSFIAGSAEITLVATAPIASVLLDADSATVRIDSVLSAGRRVPFARSGNVSTRVPNRWRLKNCGCSWKFFASTSEKMTMSWSASTRS